MNRRTFFKLLATAAPAAMAFPQIVKASTLGLGGGIAPSNRLNFGVIGAGIQGNVVLPGFLNLSSVQLIGACDVDRSRREKMQGRINQTYAKQNASEKYQGCATFIDYGELLARPDLDAVIVATPDHWHALPVLDAARAGKHIYCEKPVANSIAECRAMVAAVQRSGVVCQVGNMQRSMAEFRRAIDLVRAGYLGEITRVDVWLPPGLAMDDLQPETPPPDAADFDYARWLGPAAYRPYRALTKDNRMHKSWRWCFDFGGGGLSDWICHHYDIAVLGLGLEAMEPSEIRQAKAKFPSLPAELRATPIEYSFEVVYPNDSVISVSSDRQNGLRFTGTKGWVTVRRGSLDYSDERLKRLVIPTDQQIYGPSTDKHYQNMIECIRTGARPRSPIDEVSRVTTVAHLANAAFRSGRANITWDADSGEVIGAPETQRLLTRTYRAPYSLTA